MCDHSGHINMFSTHKRHKGTILISLDSVLCFLNSCRRNHVFGFSCLGSQIPKISTAGTFYIFQIYGIFQSLPNSLTVCLLFRLNFWPFLSPVQSISPFFCSPSQISSCCRVCRSRWVRETLRGSAFWIFSSNCWIGSVDLEGPVGSQDHLHKNSILLHWPKDPLYPLTLWWLHSSRAILKESFSCYDLGGDIVLKEKVTDKLFPTQGS